MAIAHVQSTGAQFGSSSSARSVTFTSSTTTGSFFAVCIVAYAATGTPTISGVTDNKGNTTYSSAISVDFGVSEDIRIAIYYFANGSGGASHQVTVTPGGTAFLTISVHEFSGVKTSSPATGNTAQGGPTTSTNATTGTLTNTEANEMILAAMTQSGTTTALTVGGSYALAYEAEDATNMPISAEYDVDVDANQAANWTNASRPWMCVAAAFKEEPAGGGPAGAVMFHPGMTGGMAELAGGCRG